MNTPVSHRSKGAHRRLLDVHEEDPLSGVANLFDAGMVLIAALLLALTVAWKNVVPRSGQSSESNSDPVLERLEKESLKLDTFRPTGRELGGEGQRLGTAYRLKNGEVVYIPEAPAL